jgi:acetate kinase
VAASFFTRLPSEAATYTLRWHWIRRWGLRRFGFHGMSHAYATRRVSELLGVPAAELRLVVCHLGAGASLAAVAGGAPVDTTMGFTPLDVLVMAICRAPSTPGLLLWVLRHGDLSVDDVERALDRESGLAGLSGTSGDMRRVIAAADAGDERAALALSVYLHRLRAGIAAMAAAAGGIDAVVFTGGVGEHAPGTGRSLRRPRVLGPGRRSGTQLRQRPGRPGRRRRREPGPNPRHPRPGRRGDRP